MNEHIDWTKIEQLVRREANKRFGRELGRWGVANISQFALDMIRQTNAAEFAAPAPKQGEL
jgi:hypothetical protein